MSETETEVVEAAPTSVTLGELIDKDSGTVTLVSGHIDDDGRYTELSLREMTGEDEDMLLDRGIPHDRRMTRLVEGCIEGLEGFDGDLALAYRRMTVTDRILTLFALRIISLDEAFTFKIDCPQCQHRASQTVDLSQVKVTLPEDPTVRKATLDVRNTKLDVAVMTGADEERVSKAGKTKLGHGVSAKSAKKSALESLNILARVHGINDQRANLALIRKLSTRARKAIRSWGRRFEGEIDTDAELTCPSCGYEFTTPVDVGQPSFFFPTEE